MRLAIPQHEGRVSPVFDVARNVLLIDFENRREVRREERKLKRTDLPSRAAEFLRLGANVLVCGAISASMEDILLFSGVRVIGFRCGPVDALVAAVLNGGIAKPEYCMPGCGGWQNRMAQARREKTNSMPESCEMSSRRAGGGGPGRFAGGGAGQIRATAREPDVFYFCPICGEKAAHPAGQPCTNVDCPKCGTRMPPA